VGARVTRRSWSCSTLGTTLPASLIYSVICRCGSSGGCARTASCVGPRRRGCPDHRPATQAWRRVRLCRPRHLGRSPGPDQHPDPLVRDGDRAGVGSSAPPADTAGGLERLPHPNSAWPELSPPTCAAPGSNPPHKPSSSPREYDAGFRTYTRRPPPWHVHRNLPDRVQAAHPAPAISTALPTTTSGASSPPARPTAARLTTRKAPNPAEQVKDQANTRGRNTHEEHTEEVGRLGGRDVSTGCGLATALLGGVQIEALLGETGVSVRTAS
jgi:hypothetical protein